MSGFDGFMMLARQHERQQARERERIANAPPPPPEFDLYEFNPRPDITAHELARLLLALRGPRIFQSPSRMPHGYSLHPDLQRHFDPKEPEK